MRLGHVDVAFRILTNTKYPSIGFMLENGATTLWERWEKLIGFGMNSHNQPSFGSVDVWFYKYLAGIKTTGSGFGSITIKPFVPQDLDSAQAQMNTMHGKVASSWKKNGNNFELTVIIPWNSSARIELPAVIGGKQINTVKTEDKEHIRERVFERGCGTWHFSALYQ
jgi:alpha-L-rhamnosidase